ncbi:MAG: hypothetical protein KC442_01065 [Thermomicrobiales bacterium]|nr:hypothetical protein [Thermomicrobiales bacterium]
MIAFPAFAALVAALCAGSLVWDAVHKPRPERITWALAFVIFAVAASAEVFGALLGWSATLARVYYLSGAVLVVGVLALGELYLLFPGRMPAFTTGLALLVAALAATGVWSAPIDQSRLATDGWHAIERGPLLIALALALNAGGTAILAGGALYSAWAMRARPALRRRAAGCLLIALGTLTVASGGTLTRLGRPEYLYLAMSAGIAVIFAGVLLTRGKSPGRQVTGEPAGVGGARSRVVALPRHAVRAVAPQSPGVLFLGERLLRLDAGELATFCEQWSATPHDSASLSRTEAQRVWRVRGLLSPEQQRAMDALPLATQAQLAELYEEVWSLEQPARGA